MKKKILIFAIMVLVLTLCLSNYVIFGRMLQAEYMLETCKSENGALQVKLKIMRDELKNLRAQNQ